MKRKTLPILIVDDSPEDYEAIYRALRKFGAENSIYHCIDGDQALDFLYKRGQYAAAMLSERPGIVLLDLNLPGTDGFEVLSNIKKNNDLKKIPLIIFTTSNDPADVDRCYKAGANSYVQKPVHLNGFMSAIKVIRDYWLLTTILPERV